MAAALEVLAVADPAAVSMDMIAAEADASRPLLHHYFGTKDELVQAAVENATDVLAASVNAEREGDALTQLAAGLTVYLDYVEAKPAAWSAVQRAGASPPLSTTVRRFDTQTAAKILTEIGTHDPAAEMAVFAWLDLVKGACLRWVETGTPTRPELQDFLTKAFLGCLQSAGVEFDR